MSQRIKLKWLQALTKQPPRIQIEAIKEGKGVLINDIRKIIKRVGAKKKLKVTSSQKALFKKYKRFLKSVCSCRGVNKLRKLFLKTTRGGGFILGAILPALLSLAVSEIPKLF